MKRPEKTDEFRKNDIQWNPEGFQAEGRIGQRHGGGKSYGIAVDVGTTTVAGFLWDLAEGRQLGAQARANPQSVHGDDVISRIYFCTLKPENTEKLRQKFLECFHDILAGLEKVSNVSRTQIKEVVLVGNTTMSHLFLGLNPTGLSMAPYVPAFTGPKTLSASAGGLDIAEDGIVHILSNIAGHVGSDITAVMLATGQKEIDGTSLTIDIGTNAEIILAHQGRLLTCSTAAGPAFEGARIKHGMRAGEGAIEGVFIGERDVTLTVIGQGEPLGICGSGVIDCVASMLNRGLLKQNGQILSREEALEKGHSPEISERLAPAGLKREFLLYKGNRGNQVCITQKDIREVQLAKGAIQTGITLLLDKIGVSTADIDRILLAGAFGNYISKISAMRIGLIPEIPEDRIVPVGNAAGAGASMVLLSPSAREKANSTAAEAEHVELANDPLFQSIFLRSMDFK